MVNYHVKQVIIDQDQAINAAKEDCVKRYGSNVSEDLMYDPTSKIHSCPSFWDTVLCWPPTPPGELSIQSCPTYVTGFLTERNASRQCLDNGTWFAKDEKSWTNLSACHDKNVTTIYISLNKTDIPTFLEECVPIVRIVTQTGYIVSFSTLIIAFAIMLFIKKLHCARNILHMHLFASFILRAFMFIVIKSTFVGSLGLPSDLHDLNGSLYFDINTETNNWTCKLMTSLLQYFLTANYSWIFMEGLYLHNLIFRALFADSSNSIRWYVVMGWGLPLIIVSCWITARVFLEDQFCWTTHDNYHVFLIIGIPTMVSIMLNLCLFLRISIVLYSKLRSPINEDSRRYQKWAKSTLVLVPLFGVHYALLLSLYSLIKTNRIVEIIWLFCDLLFGSFQGFFVAILYCFLNGEVKSEIQPHLYMLLTFLATNRFSRFFFPCRKKFLRLVAGRSSVCTTMSCSSLYTNGVLLHRNSKSRLDSVPKIKTGQGEKPLHFCQNQSRRNSKQRHSQAFNFSGNIPANETTLCIEHTKGRSEEVSEETLKMVQ